MNARIAKTVIYMPVFNRKAIVLESIANMRQVKGEAHLKIVDDRSTEFDGRELVALGDSGQINEKNLGIDATRMNMLAEFAASEFDYCYFTDSDTIHDPAFLSRALFMHARTNCVCGLYNTASPNHHKDGFNIDIGDDIVIRRTIPGVSMFFDKPMAFRFIQYYLDAVRFRPAVIAESRAWDWFLFTIVPQVALSRVSYLEHLYAGGLHVNNGRDVAANPTPYLAAERRLVFRRLGIPLEDEIPAQPAGAGQPPQSEGPLTWQAATASAFQKFKEADVLEELRTQTLGQAQGLCEGVLAQQRTQPDALNLLGVIQFKQGRYEAALQNLRLAVAVANHRLEFHNALGQALLMLGRNDEAIAAYEGTVLCLPQEPLPHKWLSDLYKRARRMKEASSAYGRWVELNPNVRAENQKESFGARARREREGFFEAYCQGNGIDIGWGGDLLAPNCVGWDFEDGDAERLEGAPDEAYDFVYSSHNLEHLYDVDRAVINWWRVLKPGCHLILFLPHRDLCEGRRTLPSSEPDHKHYFMPDEDDPPDTIGVAPMVERLLPDGEIIYIKTCGEPCANVHGRERSIEAVVRKLPRG